ncbi:MAG TPA: hydrogenase 2 operon protein HybA [Rhodocyclaceae bacterium]|nr:hydrogenase 2 operon protein HybA [Rhodocyclaceae bacterium]
MDRRKFFKASLAGGAALAAGAASCPAQARETNPRLPEAVGFLYDSTLCVGCKACVSACKQANDMPPEFTTTDQPYWDTPLDLSGKTLNVIKVFRSGTMDHKDQEENGFAFVKKSCMHCVDPSCVSVCPVSAMQKDPVTGIVSHNQDACIGCRYCVAACPFGVPRFTYDKAIPHISKCQLCRHRMADGKYAACAEVCPTGATLFGKVSDLQKEAARRLALKPGTPTKFPRGQLGGADWSYPGTASKYLDHVYGDKEFGGTQMLMLSGVPFEKLGYPDLPPHSDASSSEGLQHTLYGGMVMPLAFLAGLTYIAKRNAKDDDNDEGQGGSHG